MKKMGSHSSVFRFLLLSLFFVFSVSINLSAQEGDPSNGKSVFNANCAACHGLDKPMTGPPLRGMSERLDNAWLHKWIKNSSDVIKSGDSYANKIFAEYKNLPMPPFPQLSDQDIDDIIAYTAQVKEVPQADTAGGAAAGGASADADASNQLILGALILVLLVLVLALYVVRKGLRNIAEVKGVDLEEGKKLSLWQAFLKNQFMVFVTVIFLLLASAYFGYGYLMQIGVDRGYAPIQPIHYSHKIHAGDNQIDCKYCHSSARTSKTSGIPSLNVCMNCHETISEYTGEEDLPNGYTKDFYTAEIQKLYEAVGWDESTREYSKPQKPVKWVRIHNLPDFVYFNHSQHVSVAGLECQTCHGEVQEMEILEQHATLTMGWCIDCHRTTNVKTEGNDYYKKMHEELASKYGVEKLTVAQMGGLECGKCHY
ncbi:MAG TPA: c-type cytochrome [Flavobacterium sp.]|nr:c-type cytochrome [Flavobacterium sp.]